MCRDITIGFDNIGDFSNRGFKAAVGWKLDWTEFKTKKVTIKRDSKQRQFFQEVRLYKREKKWCGTWEEICNQEVSSTFQRLEMLENF